MFADITLPIPFDSFTYLVPSDLETRVMRGCRVVVPLGKNKIYTGVVLQTHNNAPQGVEIKAIMEVLDDHPVVNEQQFKFWQWIAHYYLCPLGDVMKAGLPGAMKPTDERALKESTRKRKGSKATLPPSSISPLNPLNSAQQKAMDEIEASFLDKNVTLLHGVQASDQPYQLILGVRSSIFLPFQNLGLVIVDEEHEQSYKQQEPAPRYHARNAAIMLAHMFKAKTLMGTATPSFEVYHWARKDRYGYVQLTQRYRDMQLPTIEVVDTKEAKRKRLMKGLFSPRLIEVMRAALERKEQIILFQNRRGFSSFIECKTCGWVPRCPHCDVTLTLHKKTGTLTCHYCGYTTRIPEKCPACEENKFVDIGTGTEKVEEQITQLFEGATTLRMDLDTATTRTQFERIISDFSAHKADILIGTQMVTKGLDFDRVSVVGILDADTMLNLPDFRSYERAFQTLSQVAGRAGRNNTAGHVILQTRSADSDIIRQITQADYWQMFYTQMTERQIFHYPPFRRLIYVYLRHKDDKLLDHLADEMATRLRAVFGERVLGPDRPPVARIHSLYIRKMMLKIESHANTDNVRQHLLAIQQQMLAMPIAKNLNIYYDVDPL